jgi:hypothetical protein
MVIVREGDRLVVQVRDQRIPLSAETTRDFFLKGADIHITVVADGNGRATDLFLHEGGSDQYAYRRESSLYCRMALRKSGDARASERR